MATRIRNPMPPTRRICTKASPFQRCSGSQANTTRTTSVRPAFSQNHLKIARSMILRNRKIDTSADEIQLAVCYGQPDVRKMVQHCVQTYYWHESDHLLKLNLEEPHSELELTEVLELNPSCFFAYPPRWRSELAKWCFCSAVRQGFFKESPTAKGMFYITTKAVPKKIGRPPKETEP